MKMSNLLACFAMGGACAISASAVEEKILYQESFDNYGVKAPGFTDACSVAEWPASLKHLEFRPKDKEAKVYQEMSKPQKSPQGWQDYELGFRFRFPGDSKKSFDLQIRSGKDIFHNLHVGLDSSGVSGITGFTPKAAPTSAQIKEAGFSFFIPNMWHKGVVCVKGKTMDFSIEKNGEMQKVGTAETNGEPCTGFNFSGTTSVDFDDIVVRELSDKDTVKPVVKTIQTAAEHAGMGAKVASAPEEQKLEVPEGSGKAAALLCLGNPASELRIKLGWSDGSDSTVSVKSGASSWNKKLLRDEKIVTEKTALPDTTLDFQEIASKGVTTTWSIKAFIRPDPRYYEEKEQIELATKWDNLTSASAHFFRFELHPDEKGVEIWIDGQYCGRMDRNVKLKTVTYQLPVGGAIKDIIAGSAKEKSLYLPLDVSSIAIPGVMKDAKLSLEPGEQKIKDIPIAVVPGWQNADVGAVKEKLGAYDLYFDAYLSRSRFTGMRESLLLSVPLAQYVRAWVLCAVEDDPAKDPVLTTRLKRFPGNFEGIGSAIADTTIALPHARDAAKTGVTEVGNVKYYINGKNVSVPLYLIEIPLKVGEIQDVLYQEKTPGKPIAQPYLDFEFVGKLDRPLQQLDKSHKPDPNSVSGVHIFGVTLEKGAVEMQVAPAMIGNSYMPGEKAEMSVTLRSLAPGVCKLQWEIRDIEGKIVGEGVEKVSFDKTGENKTVSVPLAQKSFGWYGINFKLFDGDRLLLEHPASFVLLDKDTRKAGYESPYFSWWFGWAHGGTTDINIAGPLLNRAGIHMTFNYSFKNEADGAPWKLTLGQIGYVGQKVKISKRDDEERKKVEAFIEDARKNFPHSDSALIFHETYNGLFPMELLDETPVLDEARIETEKKIAQNAEFLCKIYREKFPEIKLVLGNTGAGLGDMAALFRNKIPREYIDYMGNENATQTVPPEMGPALDNWGLRELARKFGYDGLMPDACFEWVCRTDRDLGTHKRAAWGVRDDLIAHAWKQKLIPVPGLIEVSNSYYNSLWGNGYLFSRNPQFYPNPSYAATATLTQVLDCAKFMRMVPTGSLTVYALEFSRDKEFIYALWTARGSAEATLEFSKNASLKVTGLYGNVKDAKTTDSKLTLPADTAATYIASDVALNTIILGKRSYREDAVPANTKVSIGSRMDNAAEWNLAMDVDPRIDNPAKHGNYPPFRKPGKYELRQVKDSEKGDCLELELIKQGKCATLMQEYVFMKALKPVEIPGRPNTVGVWIKGNSGWGKLMWEFEDAEGEKWFSCGTGGYGCDVYDWPCQASINFDGWNFVQFPLVQESPVRVPGPGEVLNQWQSGGGNRKIDYPIKLTGIGVSMTRQALNILEMQDVKTVLRFRDLSAYGPE